jgi:hypothetical protein
LTYLDSNCDFRLPWPHGFPELPKKVLNPPTFSSGASFSNVGVAAPSFFMPAAWWQLGEGAQF